MGTVPWTVYAPTRRKQHWKLPDGIEWKIVKQKVHRLQMRIAKAAKEKRYRTMRSLQWLLAHSWYGKLLAVRRVTSNKGKNTPGVDGVVWRTPRQKMRAVEQLKRRGYGASPLRRVYIAKKSGKRRPLGIPTMHDRTMQALYALTLEPIAETGADPNSYGFRRCRCCADAHDQCYIGKHPVFPTPCFLRNGEHTGRLFFDSFGCGLLCRGLFFGWLPGGQKELSELRIFGCG